MYERKAWGNFGACTCIHSLRDLKMANITDASLGTAHCEPSAASLRLNIRERGYQSAASDMAKSGQRDVRFMMKVPRILPRTWSGPLWKKTAAEGIECTA